MIDQQNLLVKHKQIRKCLLKRVMNGKVQLILITPEIIVQNPMFRNMLVSKVFKEKLVALVVDEAHCIKMWGDQFRKAFSMIGNLRSIIPSNVNVMALTAIATTETYQCALRQISMSDPVLVALSPDRGNIVYTVCPAANLDKLSELFCRDLCDTNQNLPKMVLFVQKYRDCSDLYALIEHKLGGAIIFPPGYPNWSQCR